MLLRLRRGQQDQKGVFGGHKGVNFSLAYRLDISPEERALIDHYKVASYTVHKYTIGYRQGEAIELEIKVHDLINGGSITVADLGQVQEAQESIVQGSQNLKALIEQMGKFGGEETIEI